MKRIAKLVIASAILSVSVSACTFDTDIDADVYDNGTKGQDCTEILALLEGAEDPVVRETLNDAYERCIDGVTPGPGPIPDPEPQCPVYDGDGEIDPDCREPAPCDETADGTTNTECSDPGPDPDPNPRPIDCSDIDELGQEGAADGEDSQAWYEECLDRGEEPQYCEELFRQCVGVDPNPNPNPDPNQCELAYQLGLDPDTTHPDEAFAWCMDFGMDEQTCQELSETCFERQEPQPQPEPGPDCDQVQAAFEDQGYELPLTDEEAEAIYRECTDMLDPNTTDGGYCDQVRECLQ